MAFILPNRAPPKWQKGPQLKCLHTKACSMGNKQEELEPWFN